MRWFQFYFRKLLHHSRLHQSTFKFTTIHTILCWYFAYLASEGGFFLLTLLQQVGGSRFLFALARAVLPPSFRLCNAVRAREEQRSRVYTVSPRPRPHTRAHTHIHIHTRARAHTYNPTVYSQSTCMFVWLYAIPSPLRVDESRCKPGTFKLGTESVHVNNNKSKDRRFAQDILEVPVKVQAHRRSKNTGWVFFFLHFTNLVCRFLNRIDRTTYLSLFINLQYLLLVLIEFQPVTWLLTITVNPVAGVGRFWGFEITVLDNIVILLYIYFF